MDKNLVLEVKDYIAVVTLNRSSVMNALNYSLLLNLESVLTEIRLNQDVRVLIITAAGDKAFSSGADLKERRAMNPEQVRQFIYKIRKTFDDLANLPIPVLCAINGLALGGGTELALACDLRITVPGARLGLTETSLAIIPGAGGTQRLPRLIGISKAKELIFTARQVPALEALQLGLVNEVVPREELMIRTLAIAELIAANGPIAVRQAKLAINGGMNVDLASGLSLETAAYEGCIPTEDRLEALKAFQEKRQPIFQGK